MDNSLDVTAMFKQHHKMVRENLAKAFGDEINKGEESPSLVYTEEQENIIKGLQSDNPFDRAAAREALEKSDMNDIEKSDILDAISYDNEFRIKKNGKEIKDQINAVILPAKNADLEAAKNKADELLAECGVAPTKDNYSYMCCELGIKCSYKRYSWEETYIKDKDDCCGDVCYSLSFEHQENQPKGNYPKTKDEAQARCGYNCCVDKICRIMADIKACEILLKNLKDGDEIKMTPRQLVVFNLA